MSIDVGSACPNALSACSSTAQVQRQFHAEHRRHVFRKRAAPRRPGQLGITALSCGRCPGIFRKTDLHTNGVCLVPASICHSLETEYNVRRAFHVSCQCTMSQDRPRTQSMLHHAWQHLRSIAICWSQRRRVMTTNVHFRRSRALDFNAPIDMALQPCKHNCIHNCIHCGTRSCLV